MKYLVMETHPGYAIVLDSQGRFIKAANMNYEIGQTVSSIIKIKTPSKPKKRYPVRILTMAAAACFGVVVIGLYQGVYRPAYVPYGTVEMQINPGISLTLSENYNVLELQALNEDGSILIEDYDSHGEKAQDVLYDLIYRSIDLGYLEEGGEIVLTASSEDTQWQEDTQETLIRAVEFYTQMLEISVTVTDYPLEETDPPSEESDSPLPEIVIPFGEDETESLSESGIPDIGQTQEPVQVQQPESAHENTDQESTQPPAQSQQPPAQTQPPEVQPQTPPGSSSNNSGNDDDDDDNNSGNDDDDDDNDDGYNDDDDYDDDNSDDDNSGDDGDDDANDDDGDD